MEYNVQLAASLLKIPLDIEGSNLAITGYNPTPEDYVKIGMDYYEEARLEYENQNKGVLFNNIILQWDSCDCGGGYGCSHGSYVYEIIIINGKYRHTISLEDETMEIINVDNKQTITLPTTIDVGTFYIACFLIDIELVPTEYALSLYE